MAKKVTIRDIAKHCGVSVYTVSSVLNDKGDISERTAQKVRAAVVQLGYHNVRYSGPKPLHNPKVIGLILPDIYTREDDFYFRAIKAALANGAELGYDCKVLTESELVSLFTERTSAASGITFDVAILYCLHQDQDEHVTQFKKYNIPCALIRRQTSIPGTITITDNDYNGFTVLLDHLYKQGHRNIALAGRNINSPKDGTRPAAYRDFLKRWGLNLNKNYLLQEEEKAFYPRCEQAVREHRATVIACINDNTTVRVAKMLMRHGIRIPDDIAISGYNNNPITKQFYPEITSVSIPVEDMISTACTQLIQHPPKANQTSMVVTFNNELIIRESTKQAVKS